MNNSTLPDLASSFPGFCECPTVTPTSRSRQHGTEWAEQLLAMVRPATGDVARFAAGLGVSL